VAVTPRDRLRLTRLKRPPASGLTRDATLPSAARDRPDVFLSYAREDKDFAERGLTRALGARDKDVWVDVEDIRGGASDWRADVWVGIDSATVMVFVLTPDSLASSVCGEELQRADELNKRKAAARLENWHRWRPA
jgi:hypothetical protein